MGHPPRKRSERIALIVGTILYGAAMPFLLMMAIMSPMASDAGVNAHVWTFIIAVATWPIAFLLAVIGGWLFFWWRVPRAPWFALAFPWLWLGPIIWSASFGR